MKATTNASMTNRDDMNDHENTTTKTMNDKSVLTLTNKQ